jgi:hypothetical protein
VRDRLESYSLRHVSGPPLIRFFNGIRDLGLQQLQEDRDAVSAVQPMDVSEALRSSQRAEREEQPE